MSTSDGSVKAKIAKLPLAAAIIAVAGIIDATYLTIHHYTAEPVPCGGAFDCEMVLTSPYAEYWGIPLAAFGIAAYLVAFLLAMLTAFGRRRLWPLFGTQVTIMAAFSCWLIYVQAVYIKAFCQFCLISAATTFTLFILYLVSVFFRKKTT